VSAKPKEFVVAIDGPAGAGKSTTARLAAERLGFRYLDTGAMYRALTWKALDAGVNPQDVDAVAALARTTHLALGPKQRLLVDGVDVTDSLREPAVTRSVSHVARVPGVRREMVRLQREMARGGPCVVEGRDIGTVVFPDAPVKVFLAASLEERARRRQRETGEPAERRDALAEEIRRRDAMDSDREDSPLRQADDAVTLDTTGLTIDEAVEEIVRRVRAAMTRAGPGR
jgi:cytidylate kinase